MSLRKAILPFCATLVVVVYLYAYKIANVEISKEATKQEVDTLRQYYVQEIDGAHVNDKCENSIRQTQSKWFKDAFNDFNPFWGENNIKLDKSVQRWWNSIQATKPEDMAAIMQNAFKVGIPSNPVGFTNSSRCVTCAVVGNSNILLNSRNGAKIDSNDIVFRFNRAKTKGFEGDVGSKVTYRVLYPESALINIENGLILTPFKPLDVKWLTSALSTGEIRRTYTSVLSKINCNVTNVKLLHPTFMHYCHTKWTKGHGRYPSTGMLGVLTAIHICDEVNVFGFGASKDGSWPHYWEKSTVLNSAHKKTHVHDIDFEAELLKKFHEEGIITKYT